MVRETLTDYTTQKDAIVSALVIKQGNGLFDQNLHDIFNNGTQSKDKLKIQDVQVIIETIELKLRNAEIIYHTYFASEFEKNILIYNTLVGTKLIETEFSFGTKVLRNSIEIIDPNMYKETIHMKFQLFILTIASLYENLVRLIETLIKKRVVFGDRNPHLCIHLKVLISYWDNLIELNYRGNDEFYTWLTSHRMYLDQYLSQINSLRNSFIHGYSSNLYFDSVLNDYVIKNYDHKTSGGFPEPHSSAVPELILNDFVQHVLTNSQNLIGDVLNIFKRKLSHHRTKVPM